MLQDNKVEDKIFDEPVFNDTHDKDLRLKEHIDLFQKYEAERNQNVRFLSKDGVNRNIITYIKDSVDRMNERKLKPSHKEDWQSNVFDPVTRNKLITILSKLASARMKPDIILKADNIFESTKLKIKRDIFSDLLEAANDHNNDEYQLVWEMYTGLSEGTVFGFESWVKDAREAEYVKSFNPDTGEKESETITYNAWDDVYGEIVPTDEIYPETVWVNAKEFKQKVMRCFRVREMTLEQFYDKYKGFPESKNVKKAGDIMTTENLDWGVTTNVNQENVRIMEFWDAARDKMGIWANGRELYYGCLPWNHKSLPIWVSIGEPIHQSYLYGKSLPDKMMGMQDVDNAMLNSMLDQLFISLNSPIFVDGSVDLEDGFLEPGRVYETDPGTKVQKTSMGQVDQTSFQLLSLIKQSMEESSVSNQAQGIPTGGRKTKFEVQALQEGALTIAGLSLQLMEYGMSHKYWLRMYNILQYYSMPSQVRSGKSRFKFIEIEDRKLTNGKIGKRMIQIVGSPSEKPSRNALKEIAAEQENKTMEDFSILTSRVEPIALTRNFLMDRDFDMVMKMVPNSSIKESEADKRNKDIAFYQATAEHPLVDQEKNLKDFAKAFGKDDDIVKKQEEAQQGPEGLPGLPGMPGMKGQSAPSAPQIGQDDLL